MDRVMQKSTFEHAQNVQIHITLHMRKASSGHLLSAEAIYSNKWFCLQTTKAMIRLRGCAGWSMRRLIWVYAVRMFSSHGPNNAKKSIQKGVWKSETAYVQEIAWINQT